MKVRPFYIRITKEMTPQIIQGAIDKCVDAGATIDEGCRGVTSRHEYKKQYNPSNFMFFGVDDSFMTYMDVDLEYFTNAKEITLDQLDGWLGLDKTETPEEKEAFDSMANNSGLPNGSEWEYGDRAEWTGVEFIYVAQHPTRPDRSVCIHLDHGSAYSILTCDLKKPETPQQREERERLEEIETMCSEIDKLPHGEAFAAMTTLYDLGYRKAK